MAVKDMPLADVLDITESYIRDLRAYPDFSTAMRGVLGLMDMTGEIRRRALAGELPEPAAVPQGGEPDGE